MLRSVLIAIPTTSQSMLATTALSIAAVTRSLTQAGVNVGLHNIDSAEIVTARDMFANMVLHSTAWDSLLFVDSDMSFPERLVQRMIAFDEPFVAAAYPRRSLDLQILATALGQHGDLANALAEASSFTLKLSWSEDTGNVTIKDGFCESAAVGMGCALISRKVLELMVEKGVAKPRRDLQSSKGEACYSFFDHVELAGERLGEDYSFCHRWTAELGKKLWICVDEEIAHVGQFEYRASFRSLLSPAQADQTTDDQKPG